MSLRTILLLLAIPFCTQAQSLKGKPATLEEGYRYLDQTFDDTAKYGFMTLPEDVAVHKLERSLNSKSWVFTSGPVARYLRSKGLHDAESTSDIILTSYYRYLSNRPALVEEQIRKVCYFDSALAHAGAALGLVLDQLYAGRTPENVTVTYFPVGDTVIVPIYAVQKKLFRKLYISSRGIAVIQQHIGLSSLQVKLIRTGKVPEGYTLLHRTGDAYKEDIVNCGLLPPPGWSFAPGKASPAGRPR